DPYVGDRLGRLNLSKAGLLARDQFVFDSCQAHGLPVAIAMAGGYAPDLNDIVDIQFATIQEAARRLA
nr:histone deacetylase [Gemmatales bacterium]